MNEHLNDDNFSLYCAKYYDNSSYVTDEEFYEDLSRIKYIKKLLTRYKEHNDLKERLILNHIIVLNNCFGPTALNKILYLKLKDQFKYIKPFLILLNIYQEKIYNVSGLDMVDVNIIEMDQEIIDRLRGIK